jgi:two-component system, OmpR family, response regulator ChvI
MPRRVLVVDDEPDITYALKVGLAGKGFQVETYNDPTVALAKFKPNAFDIAILDIRMPKMSGFELYREMTKVDGKTKIVFLTAFDVYREEFEKMFPNMKVTAFLKKPMTIAKLVSRLNELDN